MSWIEFLICPFRVVILPKLVLFWGPIELFIVELAAEPCPSSNFPGFGTFRVILWVSVWFSFCLLHSDSSGHTFPPPDNTLSTSLGWYANIIKLWISWVGRTINNIKRTERKERTFTSSLVFLFVCRTMIKYRKHHF
jgi:hypothetical protein